MDAHVDKTLENKRQSVTHENPRQQGIGESVFQFVDDRPAAIEQRKLQAMANNSARTMQLAALQNTSNSGLPVQRFPIPLEGAEDVFTDSKHGWMRMRFAGDEARPDTFELLLPNGQPSGSLMIHETAFDQYRFSPDGADFDDAMFPPHFMEEITGDARIDDEEELDSYAGEYGTGYRPAQGVEARISLSGLNACIGFVLESESAGFACHMLVTKPEPQDQNVLKQQANALVARFVQFAEERPENCQLLYDENTHRGMPAWINGLRPDGVRTLVDHADGDYTLRIRGRMEDGQPTVMWRGNPIRY